MTTTNTFSVMLRDEISALLEPLRVAVQQPGGAQMLLQSLGGTLRKTTYLAKR